MAGIKDAGKAMLQRYMDGGKHEQSICQSAYGTY